MAIELPNNWASFSGGDGVCTLPSINASGEMDCLGAASVTLTVSGGVGPYNWTTTVGVLTGSPGVSVVLTPPTNPGSTYVPTQAAFGITTKFISTFCDCRTTLWNCAGVKIQECLAPNSSGCWQDCGGSSCTCGNCSQAADAVCSITAGVCGKPACAGGACPENNAHCFCDIRSGDQIANFCHPCAIMMQGGAVVTVTDSLSQSAFVTVLTNPRTTL